MIDQQLFEIMCRAPACPPEFIPDMGDDKEPEISNDLNDRFIGYFHRAGDVEPVGYAEYRSQIFAMHDWTHRKKVKALTQWPSAYARMVMEAAKKGEVEMRPNFYNETTIPKLK